MKYSLLCLVYFTFCCSSCMKLDSQHVNYPLNSMEEKLVGKWYLDSFNWKWSYPGSNFDSTAYYHTGIFTLYDSSLNDPTSFYGWDECGIPYGDYPFETPTNGFANTGFTWYYDTIKSKLSFKYTLTNYTIYYISSNRLVLLDTVEIGYNLEYNSWYFHK